MSVEKLFDKLWKKYVVLAPDAIKIKELFQKTQQKPIINDHIALRTISNKKCNIDMISKNFTSLGYERKEYFNFESKNLDAYYFQHKNTNYPKVFISELRLSAFDIKVQNILNSAIEKIPNDVLHVDDIVSSGRHWDISYKVYNELYEQSEYAAWFYVFGFTANHFTIFINQLENFESIEEVNDFVKEHGYSLNVSGGEIKGSAEIMLEQSSTLAQSIEIEFIEGIYAIPSCFYEFAKRYEDKDGKLYQSFVTSSADKIFESTN